MSRAKATALSATFRYLPLVCRGNGLPLALRVIAARSAAASPNSSPIGLAAGFLLVTPTERLSKMSCLGMRTYRL
jgi:hypothetical protein